MSGTASATGLWYSLFEEREKFCTGLLKGFIFILTEAGHKRLR